MIEIHMLYMNHGYHSTGEGGGWVGVGGQSTMAVVRRPTHSQDIMFVTHERYSHTLHEPFVIQIAHIKDVNFYHR